MHPMTTPMDGSVTAIMSVANAVIVETVVVIAWMALMTAAVAVVNTGVMNIVMVVIVGIAVMTVAASIVMVTGKAGAFRLIVGPTNPDPVCL